MVTIFDIVQSKHLAAYWTTLGNSAANITEELFPAAKQMGLTLRWIKGSKGLPVVLKASAFDAKAVPRPRIGFAQIHHDMPYFKESMYVNEELRQQLNQVLTSSNQVYIDTVIGQVFNDEIRLLVGAASRREQMRTMALTTGAINMISNGQEYSYDYGVSHKANAVKAWSDLDCDPIEDIQTAIDTIQGDTGEVLTRAMCDASSWKNLRNNKRVYQAIYRLNPGTGTIVSNQVLKEFLKNETGLEVLVNNHQFTDESGVSAKYMPDNTFVMFPAGPVGQTWFGTTPAESDLATSNVANVSIVDTGVAITTTQIIDPVNIETIVSQICLPSLERADSIYILDTAGAATPPAQEPEE